MVYMRDKMIKRLDSLMYFCEQFRVTVKFKDEWVKPHLTDYKNMNDDDLFEFFNICIYGCSQPRG